MSTFNDSRDRLKAVSARVAGCLTLALCFGALSVAVPSQESRALQVIERGPIFLSIEHLEGTRTRQLASTLGRVVWPDVDVEHQRIVAGR